MSGNDCLPDQIADVAEMLILHTPELVELEFHDDTVLSEQASERFFEKQSEMRETGDDA